MSTIAFTRGVPSADLLAGRRPQGGRGRGARARSGRCAGLRAERVPRPAGVDRPSATECQPSGWCCSTARSRVSACWSSSCSPAEGGSAVVEDPTYDRSLIALRRSRRRDVAVPLEADGVDVDAVRAALDHAATSARMIYVIPTFQNPDRGDPLARQAGRAGAARPDRGRAAGRGRPLRSAAVRGGSPTRRCSSSTAATTSPTRRRSPRPSPRACARATSCCPNGWWHRSPSPRHQHLHRAQRVRRGDARGVLPRRLLRTQRRIRHRRSQDPPRCDGARAARVVPRRGEVDDPGGRLLLLDRAARRASRRQTVLAAAIEAGVPFVAGRGLHVATGRRPLATARVQRGDAGRDRRGRPPAGRHPRAHPVSAYRAPRAENWSGHCRLEPDRRRCDQLGLARCDHRTLQHRAKRGTWLGEP